MSSTTQRLATIALLTVFLSVAAQLTLPLPLVPLTGQTLAVGLIAALTTWRISLSSVSLYLLIGCLGLPVFAGGTSGWWALIGPTGGYLIGFLAYAGWTSWWTHSSTLKFGHFWLSQLTGALMQLALGTWWLKVVAHLPLTAAALTGFWPFIIPAFIKIWLIYALVKLCQRRLALPVL